MHEILRLSKKMREALRDALADSESFLTQVPIPTKDDRASCPQCHILQQQVSCITFTPEDMFLKDNQHERLLYYTGYIRFTHIERIQVDLGLLKDYPQKTSLFSLHLAKQVVIYVVNYDYNYNHIWL